MNQKDKVKIKDKIISDINKLEVNITQLIELTKPIAPENSIGRVSRMDAINNKSVNEAALRQANLKMNKLQLALKKIETPNFGVCSACKNAIPLPRLMFMPESSHCVACAN